MVCIANLIDISSNSVNPSIASRLTPNPLAAASALAKSWSVFCSSLLYLSAFLAVDVLTFTASASAFKYVFLAASAIASKFFTSSNAALLTAIDFLISSAIPNSTLLAFSSTKTKGRTKQAGASISQSNIYDSSNWSVKTNAAVSILSASLNASVSNSNSVTSTISNAKSVTSTDKKTYVLQPQSYRIIDGIYLQSGRFWDCDVVARVSSSQTNIENGISYPKEASPLSIRIIITYSYDENFKDKKTYELDAYVNRFSNWNKNKFIKQKAYKKCESDRYFEYRNVTETYSPMRYYIKYGL